MKHPWPGNVRELENIIVQAILYSKTDTILPSDIPLETIKESKTNIHSFDYEGLSSLPYKAAKEKLLYEFNHNYIGAKLSISKGNITHVAKQCRMDRQALQQIMKRFSIDPELFR